MSLQDALIGKGIKYPLEYNDGGGVNKNGSIDRINQSIHIILDTPVGSRFMLPDFGSQVSEMRFEPNDAALVDLLEHHIRSALVKWERRISVTEIIFQDSAELRDQSILFITIKYIIINSNVPGNFVYPFNYGPRQITEVIPTYGL